MRLLAVLTTRRLVTGSLTFALLALLSLSIAAQASDRAVVVPTGVYPTDVHNVQEAVDEGGRVLLRATDASGDATAFNFGPGTTSPSGVALGEADIDVMGETVGSVRTTIRGGFVALVTAGKVSTRITGIHFDEQRSSAVVWIRSSDAAFIGNRVTDVVGQPLFSGLVEGRGIKFLGNSDPDEAISGDIVIEGNHFDGLQANLSDAIVFHAVAADATIRDNDIGTVQNTGMLFIRNSGHVSIHDNAIVPGSGVAEPSFGNGIFLVGNRGGSYDIHRNTYDGANPLANAIIVSGSPTLGTVDDLAIADNDLTVRDSDCCEPIALVGDVQDATLRANRLYGNVPAGIGLFGTLSGRDPGPTGNVLIGNDFRVDAPTDLFLDANTAGNVALGGVRSVVDLGTDNVVTGHDSGQLGNRIGPEVSQAHRRTLTSDPEMLTGSVPPLP